MNNNFQIYKRGSLKLRESSGYVEPSNPNGNSTSNLSMDISKAKNGNPNSDSLKVDLNSYDGDSYDNPIEVGVSGKTAQDASKNLQQLMKKPAVKKLVASDNVNANVKIGESVKKLRENAIVFTKDELNNLFKTR